MSEFKLTKAQDKARDMLISDAVHCCLGGGSRCVSGDTLLDGHDKTIKELAGIGEPIIVKTTHGYQEAESPFKKGSAMLYEVVTSSGKRIEVTSDHRFWVNNTWLKTKDIKIGDQIAVSLADQSYEQSLLLSSLVSFLSAFLSNGRRLKQKLLGCLGGCFDCCHQYDQQPLLLQVSGLTYRALQFDVLAHNRTYPCPTFLFLQLLGLNIRKPLVALPSLANNLNDLELCRPSSMNGSPLKYPAWLLKSLSFGQIYGWFQGSHLGNLLYRLRCSFSESFLELKDNSSHRLLRFSYLVTCNDTPMINGYRLEKVISITETAVKDYYTLHVPSTEQYFANSMLHHNSGKTFLLIRMIIVRALKAPKSRHAIFRFRFNAIKASIIYDTLPKVFELCFPGLWNKSSLNKTDWFYTLPNGSEIWFGGLDDKERTEKILGQEYATIYLNETSQIPWQSRVLAMSRLAQKTENLNLKAYYDLNPGAKTHWVYRLFIDHKDPETKQLINRPNNYGYFKINPIDNEENLDPDYLAELDDLPLKARKRFRDGDFSDISDGVLWTEELLEQNRVLGQEGTLPDWLRVVVAVDPSGCSGAEDKRSDEIGITVCALGTDGHGYLLEDLSGKYSPEEWGEVVVSAYERHLADRVIGEKNFGGDMVRAVIHAVDSNVAYNEVNASRGKVARAEPIAALYEKNKIHHIGHFPELEDQMCSMTQSGYEGLKSPDRCDSAVWGFTELFPGMTKKASEAWSPPKVTHSKRSASRYMNKKTRY